MRGGDRGHGPAGPGLQHPAAGGHGHPDELPQGPGGLKAVFRGLLSEYGVALPDLNIRTANKTGVPLRRGTPVLFENSITSRWKNNENP